MTTILCDIISDIHVESMDDFNWEGQPTSPFCIIAGDVARDRGILKSVLTHLGKCYQQVFYIDGNEEHRDYLDDLNASYDHLGDMLAGINNLVYLRDEIVVLNGVAIIAANGWWTYDFDPSINIDSVINGYCDYTGISRESALRIVEKAYEDSCYLVNSVQKIQRHPDIKVATIITHTLPCTWLINHDISLVGEPRFNCMGNQHMTQVFQADSEFKIKVWGVGHYHYPIDRELNGVRYMSNVRGRANTPWYQHAFYPKRITFDEN